MGVVVARVLCFVGFSINPATEEILVVAIGTSHAEVVANTAERAGNLVQRVFDIMSPTIGGELGEWFMANGIAPHEAHNCVREFGAQLAEMLREEPT